MDTFHARPASQVLSGKFFKMFPRIPQRCIQDPVKHLRWKILRKYLAVKSHYYFCKTLHLIGLTEFWMRFCSYSIEHLWEKPIPRTLKRMNARYLGKRGNLTFLIHFFLIFVSFSPPKVNCWIVLGKSSDSN